MELHQEVVRALRARLSQESADASGTLSDVDLLRFLRARSMDLDSAHSMVRAHLVWAARVRPAAISQVEVAPVLRDGVVRLVGGAQNKPPVMWFQAACWKPAAYNATTFVSAIVYFVEKSLKVGDRFVAVFDLTGWRLGFMLHAGKIHGMITTLQEQYPERLVAAVVVRAPVVFGIMWELIKGLLDPSTADKVHFAEHEPEKERALLTRFIDERDLPTALGGQLEREIPVPNIPGEPNLA